MLHLTLKGSGKTDDSGNAIGDGIGDQFKRYLDKRVDGDSMRVTIGLYDTLNTYCFEDMAVNGNRLPTDCVESTPITCVQTCMQDAAFRGRIYALTDPS